MVHEHAHQAGGVRRRLRLRGDRQPSMSGRLFQLLHTKNSVGQQRRRNQLVLRLLSTRQNIVDSRKDNTLRERGGPISVCRLSVTGHRYLTVR